MKMYRIVKRFYIIPKKFNNKFLFGVKYIKQSLIDRGYEYGKYWEDISISNKYEYKNFKVNRK